MLAKGAVTRQRRSVLSNSKGMAVTFENRKCAHNWCLNQVCSGCCWRAFWVGLPACGAALWGLLSVADLWGPGRPSHLGLSFIIGACG